MKIINGLCLILLSLGCLSTSVPNSSRQSPGATPPVYLPLVLTGSAEWWQPPLGADLQIQFTGESVDQSVEADVFDIDLFDNSAEVVTGLHSKGRRVLCYINVGAWEDWRPDQDQFPASVLGKDYEGWPGEKWLDIRRIDLLAPILRARFDQCRSKGFDGIEPDNLNGYLNDTGFPLSYQDQVAYNRWLADEAHQRGLAIGLKNDTEQVSDLLTDFDFAVMEECLVEGWCADAAPFIANGKAAFGVEYTDRVTVQRFLTELCPQAQSMHLSAVLKNRELDAWRQACP